MKKIVVFPNRIDGKFCVCPFQGYKVSSYEEFIEVIKKYFNKETGYPGLFFKLNDRVHTLIFAGYQYQHDENGRWCLFNTKTDTYPHGWFKLTKEKFENELSNLFDDAVEMQKKIDTITAIVNANGGISIPVG